jgi:uncharacterized membrane protein
MEMSFLMNNAIGENLPDILTFFGRFHPLVVHLPIGFLLMAVLVQFSTKWPKFSPLQTYVSYLWGLGALSALLAVVFGYILSLSGDYDEDTLFWHKWSGVFVFLTSLSLYYLSKKFENINNTLLSGLVLLVFGSLIYTGHLGGNLTHGPTYLLEYAPNPIRGLAGLPPKAIPRKKVTTLDSADVFLDIVHPMMINKCTGCHNDRKMKGDLLLTSYQAIMKGGENGEIIIPGDAEASELFRRITLPEEHDDFMPSEGKRPLSETEVELLEWWIASGAPSSGFVTTSEASNEVISKISSFLGLDKNRLLAQTVDPADESIIDSLQNSGFVITRLMKDNYFLDANFALSERALNDADINLLLQLKEQLIWLDLRGSNVNDSHLEKIGTLENLIKLNLSGNDISDTGMQHLIQLPNLESLNIYDSNVSEGLLTVVPKLTRLKTVYLWQTKVNDSIIVLLQKRNKNLKIVYNRENLLD